MAMPSEKMTWPDERDGLISWLRGEFAAANAIIDSLCHHLRAVGDSGEYDAVIGSIQQRRCNWNAVLHMQQYFSVAEVINAVQQATWRRQQSRHSQRFYDSGVKAKRFGSGTGFKPGGHVWTESFGNSGNAGPARGGAREKVEEAPGGGGDRVSDTKKDFVTKTQEDASSKISGNSEVVSKLSEPEASVDDKCTSSSKENDSNSTANQNKNSNLAIVPKTFVGNEMFDGKPVNAVEGLKLYENFYSDAEVLTLFALVNDLRSAGRRGQLQGQTFIASKRPSKGHGREMIQFGLPISDSPVEDEVSSGSSKADKRVEAIPPLLQGVAERLLSRQVTAVKPDSCIIDFYNEGDHSQPHMWPLWFGKPICVLFLTECDMTFGRIVTADHPGDYKGALRLSLKPGSLLALQGKSVDSARYAIPSLRRQRALVILTKSQPKKSTTIDGPRLPPPGSASWGPPPSRPPNHHHHLHIRHTGVKHYAPVSSSGVLPVPQIQPLLLTTPAMPVSVPAPPGSSGWPAGAPPPRHPVPGTGVFFPPPGSDGNSSSPLVPASSEINVTVESTPTLPGKENGSGKMYDTPIGVGSPKGKVVDVKAEKKECNGSTDQSSDNTVMNI